jgi:DNA-binding MarR family transcriptional regulator
MTVTPLTPPTAPALADLAFVLLGAARELQQHHTHDPGVVELTATEINVLRCIEDRPGTTPAAVAEVAGLQRSNLSAALRTLVRKGMVERRPDPADRRSHSLHPTAAAAENLTRLRALWTQVLQDVLGEDPPGLEEAVALLDRLGSRLVEARRAAAPAPAE